ncbi:unnamed protein product, partial [Rotaria magnacalcarata]
FKLSDWMQHMDLNLTHPDHSCFNDDDIHRYGSSSIPTAKLRFSLGTTVAIYSIYFLPFCFGVFGNISVCLIFFQQRKLRSITNTFLMNLCLNDLIVLCVSIPMTLSAALLEHWVFGVLLCKLVNFTPTLTALVSTFTVTVIAVERWFFIVNKQKFHRNCTIVTLILLWCVSIFIALPEFVSRELQEFVLPTMVPYMFNNDSLVSSETNDTQNISNNSYGMQQPCPTQRIFYCVLEPGLHMRLFSYFVIIVQYLVPFLFVSVSCYSIGRFLKKRMQQMCAYETHNRGTTPRKIIKRNSTNSVEERELASSYDTRGLKVSNDGKSSHFFSRFRRASQCREKYRERSSLHITDPQQYLQSQSHTRRRFHRSRKLLICIAALFTISWLPLTIVQIYLEHNEEVLYTRDGANFAYGFLLIPSYLISSISAWFNPVIYNYINRSFRREFYALYSCFFTVATSTARRESTTFVSTRMRKGAQHLEESVTSAALLNKKKQGNATVTFAV